MIQDQYLTENYILSNVFAKFPTERPEVVTSPFGWRVRNGVTEFHYGDDFINQAGHKNLFSVVAGRVIGEGFEDKVPGHPEIPRRGYYLQVRFNFIDGRTWDGEYNHMKKRSSFRIGNGILPAVVIGEIGQTGTATGDHLHFMVVADGRYREPSLWLNNLELIAQDRRRIRRLRELGDVA